MSDKNNQAFLSVKNLVVEYTSDGQIVQAVNGVSFDLQKGRTIGLVGETGAGKTTIAKTILRILPDRAAHIKGGEVLLDGKNLLAASEEEMRSVRGDKISMVFQDPMTALNPTMRVGDQIAEVIIHHNDISQAESEKRAGEMLEMVGIPAARYREYPHQFSGGMKQRVVIAMALACTPDILLADEPTTALDVTIQSQILELINRLKAERGLSIIFITHDLGVVANMADDIAVMYAGKIVEYGTADDIFYDPRHPYTWALLSSMPDLDTKEKLDAIPGTPPNMIYPPKGDAFAARNKYAMQIDYEEHPPFFKVSDTHYAATWLLHPDAPKVEVPKAITDRIRRMTERLEGGTENG